MAAAEPPPPALARGRRAGAIALAALRRHGVRYRDHQAAVGRESLLALQAHLEQHIAVPSFKPQSPETA